MVDEAAVSPLSQEPWRPPIPPRSAAQGNQTAKYDPERRPIRVTLSGAAAGDYTARFAYDGDGSRRKRLDTGGTVHYLGDYEVNLPNTGAPRQVTKYYKAFGRLVGFRRDGTIHWVGTDHLDSTVRVTDASFTALDSQRYRAYGAQRDPGTSLKTDKRFTGQTEDASIGLHWYASRAYDPTLGRFGCPDSVIPDPRRPQDLNRYAYVRGNPLRYADPTGHRATDGYEDSPLDRTNRRQQR